MNRKIFLFLPILIFSFNAFSQDAYKLRERYIREYKVMAINEMNRYGIPASITLAQGILESGAGGSRLATKAKNHFGIKCHKSWKGKKIYQKDDVLRDCFRVYNDESESYRDHSEFLFNRSRYAFLFELEITDYKGWARGLKKAGYATNPKYSRLLIKLIEDYKLYRYDEKYSPDEEMLVALYQKGYHFPQPEKFRKVEIKGDRQVYQNNKKLFVFVEKGDTYFQLARKFNIRLGKLKKYNDMDESDFLKVGQMVYLEKKCWRNKDVKRYIVTEEDTWYSISQRYGVRIKWLWRFNRVKNPMHIHAGQKLWLNFYKPSWRK
ncbi:MAG: glucosaminidase domain-containing protein [Bacteroidota bacterium]|nr:glucosaminidase domain-containing protein [Bacteroidota bacterium]